MQLVVEDSDPLIAAAKMEGLVVTPTTDFSSTSRCRSPLWMRSRDRSSSHTLTPDFARAARFSFWVMIAFSQRSPVRSWSLPTTSAPAAGPAPAATACRLSRAAATTASSVSPNSSYSFV